jgi:hypothetical protein
MNPSKTLYAVGWNRGVTSWTIVSVLVLISSEHTQLGTESSKRVKKSIWKISNDMTLIVEH